MNIERSGLEATPSISFPKANKFALPHLLG
jgi:hypothetical protein